MLTHARASEGLPGRSDAPAPDRTGISIIPWLASRLRGLHLVLGVLLVLTFLGTGQYMDLRYDHLRGMDDATRLLFRSIHIYVLWAGLLNLTLGLYLVLRSRWWSQGLQLVGSALIVVSAGLLVAAFFTEPLGAGLERPLTRPALYMVLHGCLLHLLAGVRVPASRSPSSAA